MPVLERALELMLLGLWLEAIVAGVALLGTSMMFSRDPDMLLVFESRHDGCWKKRGGLKLCCRSMA